MIADIVLTDDDQGREYHLEVWCVVRPEIDGARQYCVDVQHVYLTEAVAYFDKQGSGVYFAESRDREAAARFVERKYDKEIRELCIEAFQKAEVGA